MLDYILKSTSDFLESKPKAERKMIGQFFTSKETAIYMSSLFCNVEKERLRILDPGTGSGILIAALIHRLQESAVIKELDITCYENNDDILPLLRSNMEYLKDKSKIKIEYLIINDNYILSQKDDYNSKDQNLLYERSKKYDVIIGNSPYYKPEIHDKPSTYECGNGKYQYKTLPTYIRNAIDHPSQSKAYSKEELIRSIELLLNLCN